MPFNLTIPKKKVLKTVSENPSLAEGVRKWEKKTPERFHTNRHGEPFRFTEVRKSQQPKLKQITNFAFAFSESGVKTNTTAYSSADGR